MSRIPLVLFLLFAFAFICCQNNSTDSITDEGAWLLGWRMIENSWDENYDIAELQFDSLLNSGHDVDLKFLKVGLETKSSLNKHTEVARILNDQSVESKRELCMSDLLRDQSACMGIPKETPKNKALQIELIKMYINDQYSRSNLMNDLLAKYELSKNEVITDSFAINTDKINRTKLKEIINEYGFPTRQLIGKDAMEGVFMIIQHADEDKEWQRSQLENIKNAVKNGDVDGQSYAYLYDRIKVNYGEKQLYGTQFARVDLKNKIAELADCEDLHNLDNRRREVGMMPIEVYKKIMLKNM